VDRAACNEITAEASAEATKAFQACVAEASEPEAVASTEEATGERKRNSKASERKQTPNRVSNVGSLERITKGIRRLPACRVAAGGTVKTELPAVSERDVAAFGSAVTVRPFVLAKVLCLVTIVVKRTPQSVAAAITTTQRKIPRAMLFLALMR
jgi:hypothetical protein